MEAVEKFKRVLEEVKRTNATATRSAGTDFRCRDWFTEHGDEILALLTSPTDAADEESAVDIPLSLVPDLAMATVTAPYCRYLEVERNIEPRDRHRVPVTKSIDAAVRTWAEMEAVFHEFVPDGFHIVGWSTERGE